MTKDENNERKTGRKGKICVSFTTHGGFPMVYHLATGYCGNPWHIYELSTIGLPISEQIVDLGNRNSSVWPNGLTGKAPGRPEVHAVRWGSVTDWAVCTPFEWGQSQWVPSKSLRHRWQCAYTRMFSLLGGLCTKNCQTHDKQKLRIVFPIQLKGMTFWMTKYRKKAPFHKT